LVIIDDESNVLNAFSRALRNQDLELMPFADPAMALQAVFQYAPQVVITDLRMPGIDGLSALKRIMEFNPCIQVIVITGQGTIDEAVDAMKKGAHDFLSKPFNNEEIRLVIDRAFEKAALLEDNRLLRHRLRRNSSHAFDWGRSREFRDLLDRTRLAAESESTILISGESGVGKGILAQFIVAHSRRILAPFLTLHGATAGLALLDSGSSVNGGDSPAHSAYPDKGKIASAAGGTILLREVDELSPNSQHALVKMLEDNPFDVRIIAITRKNLRHLMEEGLFREDLFYLLNVVHLGVCPLRQRPQDLHGLITFFIARHCKKNLKGHMSIGADALRLLEEYPWPGNIRELEHAMERAVILAKGHQIASWDLPAELSLRDEWDPRFIHSHGLSLAEIELTAIRDAVKRNHGNKAVAARELGISARTISRKLGMGADSGGD